MANVNLGAFDFSGYATKNDLLCADGRTIRRNAFKECDGTVVPLVWNHGSRDNPKGILGHALLENRDDGVYMYGAFNNTEDGQLAKEYVKHGDITGLSIWANRLKQKGGDVLHGIIREVSLVLSGANPGAKIDVVMAHGEDFEDELYYELGISNVELKHSGDTEDPDDDDDDDDNDETVGDVLKTLNEKQRAAVIALIKAVEKAAKGKDVKHADDDDDTDDDEDDDDLDDETVGQVLDSLNKKQKAAVAMMIDSLMADRSFAHADNDGEETVGDVLSTLTEDEKIAVEALIDAIRSGKQGSPTIEHAMLMHADVDDDDDGTTLGEVLENMSEKKQAAVMTMIDTLTGDDDEDEEDDEVEHGYYDEYEDEYEDDEYEDDEFEHADDELTVGSVLSTLTDEEKIAVEALIDAIRSDKQGTPTIEHSMLMHADTDEDDGPTLGEILEDMSDEKQAAVMTMIEVLTGDDDVDENDNDEKDEEDNMMRHAYDSNYDQRAGVNELFADAMNDIGRFGSLREAMMAHSNDFEYDDDFIAHAYPTDEAGKQITYGMADVKYLFPEARLLNNTPDFIKRDTNWVDKFMSTTHKSPFSRVKTIHANITADEARAKGYVKGNQKVDEVFTLLKRVTNPTTVYKTQAMDRDDLIDIRDFGVVAWLKAEMRLQLNEEIARAALIGDGRSGSSNDKISELCIRPIYTDDSLYSIKVPVVVPSDATDDDKAKAFIKSCIKARKDYKGSGNPTLYTTSEMLTSMLLLEDGIGRSLYSTEAELATKLRVKEIVEVPVMEGIARADGAKTLNLAGIVVNPADYNFGADDGGKTSFFDDFDIQFNKERYLIEARCSGALTVPYSAMVLELDPSGAAAHTVTPDTP